MPRRPLGPSAAARPALVGPGAAPVSPVVPTAGTRPRWSERPDGTLSPQRSFHCSTTVPQCKLGLHPLSRLSRESTDDLRVSTYARCVARGSPDIGDTSGCQLYREGPALWSRLSGS